MVGSTGGQPSMNFPWKMAMARGVVPFSDTPKYHVKLGLYYIYMYIILYQSYIYTLNIYIYIYVYIHTKYIIYIRYIYIPWNIPVSLAICCWRSPILFFGTFHRYVIPAHPFLSAEHRKVEWPTTSRHDQRNSLRHAAASLLVLSRERGNDPQ